MAWIRLHTKRAKENSYLLDGDLRLAVPDSTEQKGF